MAGQVWSVDVLGGFMYSDELSDKLRMVLLPAVKFRQFCDARDAMEKGLNAGESYNWNIYSRVATGGGQLLENQPMPETNFTVSQGTMTVVEYGNSVPYTGLLDNLSEVPVREIVNKAHLKYLDLDAVLWLEDWLGRYPDHPLHGADPTSAAKQVRGLAERDHDPMAMAIFEQQAKALGHLFTVARQLAEEEGIAEGGYRLINNTGIHGFE